jgi:glycerol-3-phosphate acyltransferase PlsY
VDIVVSLVMGVVAYLLGSIPTGYLVAQGRGVDIRTVGSGNIGATNVLRTLGKPAGIFVLLMDALKGWLAVAVLPTLTLLVLGRGAATSTATRAALEILGGLCVIVGHNYTCWLHFKGGKGIATSAGVLLALVPWALLIIFVVWVLVFLCTRYVSLASIAASATLPFAAWLTHETMPKVIVTVAMALLAIGKHRANIQRLLQGTEPRFERKPREAAK